MLDSQTIASGVKYSQSLWSANIDMDTRHDTDTDMWIPVKHIKLNLDINVGVMSVLVSCWTGHGKGLRCPCFIDEDQLYLFSGLKSKL